MKNNYTVLFRSWDINSDQEYEICREYFPTIKSRTRIYGSIVIGRYSVLPYYNELDGDLFINHSRLINTYHQHKYIANFDYYEFLRDYTFQSWNENQFPYTTWGGPFVVKGTTNSKKEQWNKSMFALDRQRAIEIACELKSDHYIGSQDIIFRKYQPLKTFEIGLNDQPFTNEWRFFIYKETILSYGYYWIQAENIPKTIDNSGLQFIDNLLNYIKNDKPSNFPNFYVLDIGELETGEWILIEMNDAQMSGLSDNDPHELYQNLKQKLCKEP